MTLADLQKKWHGKKIFGSTEIQAGQPTRVIAPDIHRNAEDGMYYAWASASPDGGGEHIRAATVAALDRRLHSLAQSE